MKLKQIHTNVWIGLLLIVLSVFFYIKAGSFNQVNAMIWPRAVLIVIIVLAVLLISQGCKLTAAQADTGAIPLKKLAGPMAAFLYMVLYAVMMKLTGYFVSSAIFLPVGMLALGQRNWKAIVGVTLGLEVFIYYMFVVQLALRMP